ncbi:MAG TPA: RnfABCDGE type electron transport complex subunit B [Burkholderiales bacterium]
MKREAVALVDEARCIGCVRCIDACPVDAIVGAQGVMHTVVEAWCIGCDLCLPACPVDCIALVAPKGEWTAALKRAAGERGRRRRERLARSEIRSHDADERKSILADLLGRK